MVGFFFGRENVLLLVIYCFETLLTRYDVWLVDYRLSSRFPLSQVQRDYTMDDIANYDHPAAIDKILEVTKKVRKLMIFLR